MKKKLKIAFMGSPYFSAELLEDLYKKHEIVAVFTNKDKPAGRGKRVMMTPVKEKAIELGITNIYDESPTKDILNKLKADISIVFAYSKLISKSAIEACKYKAVNIHTSLLPKHRGSSPIQASILNQDKVTGVTLMLINEKLDEGNIIIQKEIDIGEKDTGDLLDIMTEVSKEILDEFLIEPIKYIEKSIKQDHNKSNYTSKINKSDAKINWNMPSKQVISHIRAYNPWPVAFSYYSDLRIKIYKSYNSNIKSNMEPGTVSKLDSKGIYISTFDNDIIITSIQRPGRKVMKSTDFINSNLFVVGEKLGG